MNEKLFIDICKHQLLNHLNARLDKKSKIDLDDISVLWSIRVLKNNIGIFQSSWSEGTRYEIVYNGEDKTLTVKEFQQVDDFTCTEDEFIPF